MDLKDELPDIWRRFLQEHHQAENWWERKKQCFKRRQAQIKRVHLKGEMQPETTQQKEIELAYDLYIACEIEQGDYQYIEEIQIPYRFRVKEGKIIDHAAISPPKQEPAMTVMKKSGTNHPADKFSYNRDAAVAYANKWWNSYNPSYETFQVDCTNYVSQCLFAGGAPMRGEPAREEGWWYKGGGWSFSWSVSHSLRWYLSTSEEGLTASEVKSAEELLPGDIICYDFERDGKWDHTTIVVAKDKEGMPLVNAHTDNSKNRYWTYEDSLAWTEQTAYTFFRIGV